MKEDLFIIDSFVQSLPEDARAFVMSALKDKPKQESTAKWPSSLKDIEINNGIKTTHYKWLEKCLEKIEDNSMKKLAALSIQETVYRIKKFKSKDLNNWIFREFILNNLDAPSVIVEKDKIKDDIAYPILQIHPDKTEDLIYMLGLEDIGAAIKSSVHGEKIQVILAQIDKRFINVFKEILGSANLATTSSLGFDQLYFAAQQPEGVKNITISFGLLRLALALHAAGEQVRSIFFRKNDPKIYEYFVSVKKPEQQTKITVFVRSLLNAIVNLNGI